MWGSKPPIRLTSRASGADTDSDDRTGDDRVGFIPVAAQGGSVVRVDESDWSASGDATATRVAGRETDAIETDGTTLRVDGGGDLGPTISTTAPVRDTDLTRYRSVTATVLPGSLRGTSAPLLVRFRLRHGGGQHNGRTNGTAQSVPSDHRGRAEQSRTDHARSSRTFHAPQGQPIRLYWDLRGIDEELLQSATALDIVFERADRPASEGPYGRGTTGIVGSVYVDSAFLSDSPDVVSAARLQTHWQQLEAGYGSHEQTVTEHKTGSSESGVVRFGDDTRVPFELTMGDDGSHTFTLDGETYEFADGMAAVERR